MIEEDESTNNDNEIIDETLTISDTKSPSPKETTSSIKIVKKKISEDSVIKKKLKLIDDSDSLQWFSPIIEIPPKDCFKSSNETVVSYFKNKEKYKMVNRLKNR